MRLKLPKGNIEWTVETPSGNPYTDYRHRRGGPFDSGMTRITGTFRLPDGSTLNQTVALDPFCLRDDQRAVDHMLDGLVEGLSRSVGRYMLLGQKP